MLVLACLLATLAALLTAITLAGPDIDLMLTSLFFDPAANDFVAGKNSAFAWLRDHGAVAIVTCVSLVSLALWRPARWPLPGAPGRAAAFLAVSLLLGPGLIVNGVLKESWGRPRPGMIVEFGGAHRHLPWWNTHGTCRTNCSFVSGEAAAAAWMFAPAMLTPPQWRVAAMAGAGLFTAGVGLLRLAAGGHFLTDIVFGVLIAILVVLAVHRLVFGWRSIGASHLRRKRSTSSTAA